MSWLHLASWCQENAKDIAERCTAFICHAALGSASYINSFVPLSRIQKHISDIVGDTALASARSPLCKAGMRTRRHTIR